MYLYSSIRNVDKTYKLHEKRLSLKHLYAKLTVIFLYASVTKFHSNKLITIKLMTFLWHHQLM